MALLGHTHCLMLSPNLPPLPSGRGSRREMPRRRPSYHQGRALEVLGHAIEYLVDSRLFDRWETPADAEAVHLLMERSRAVFEECAEIQTFQQRVKAAIRRRLQDEPVRAEA